MKVKAKNFTFLFSCHITSKWTISEMPKAYALKGGWIVIVMWTKLAFTRNVIRYYLLSCLRKLATVKSFKADVSSVSPSSELFLRSFLLYQPTDAAPQFLPIVTPPLFSQGRFCSWPFFESKIVWNSETAFSRWDILVVSVFEQSML